MRERGVDRNPVTILSELQSRSELVRFGGADMLASIEGDESGLPKEILSYCMMLRGCTLAREQRIVGGKLAQLARVALSPEERISKTKALIASVENLAVSQNRVESLEEVVSRVGYNKFCDPSIGETYIKTPWEQLNDMMIGLKVGRMYVVGAYSSHGKSSWALNVALHAALTQSVGTAYFPLEMDNDELFRLCVCNVSGVNNVKVLKGEMDKEERTRFSEGVVKISESPLRIANLYGHYASDVGRAVRQLRAEGHDIRFIILDHLQLMRARSQGKDMREAFTRIGNELLEVTMDLGLCTLALSQLRKADKRDDKRPTIDDFRETSAFAENSFGAGILYRPEFFKAKGDRSKVQFFLDKLRSGGRTGKVDFKAIDKYCRYEVVDNEPESD